LLKPEGSLLVEFFLVTIFFSFIFTTFFLHQFVEATDSKSEISEFIDKAESFYQKGKYEEAITWLDKALEIDPRSIAAVYNKGLALSLLGKYEEAITLYDKVLEIEPDEVRALFNKGVVLYHLGKYEEAITLYDKVLEIDPIDIATLNNKAVAVSKLTPDFPDTNPKISSTANNALLYTTQLPFTTITFVSHDDTTFSIGSTTTSSSSTAHTSSNINGKIIDISLEHVSNPATIVKIQTGDTSTPYDEAIKIDPDNIQLLTNAGIYLADKKGMYNNAIDLFDKVLKKDTTYVQAIYNKGETLEKLGRSDEAKTLLDTAKKLDPTYEGDFITSPPKVSKASVSAVSILASAD
jgi:tetratricopeptide (TPR) repeat protein